MKQIFFTATLLISLMAAAGSDSPTGARNFKITSATFDPVHIEHPGQGTLSIDYEAGLVTLDVVRAINCPAGRMCIQVMPMPLSIELPITSIKTDDCGIHHVVASVDMRPADGELQQLSVDDPSDLTCQTLVAVIPQAQYLTASYSRINSEPVKNVSTMRLELINRKD